MKFFKKSLIILMSTSVIFSYYSAISRVEANEIDKEKNDMINEIMYSDSENYTKAYKEYMELSDEEKEKYPIVPNKYNVTVEKFLYETEDKESNISFEDINIYPSFIKQILVKATTNELPKSYDLRKTNPYNLQEHGNITIDKVEDQGKEGLCWAYATLGALKTHLAVKGENNGTTLDFSESHMNYLTSNLYQGKNFDVEGENTVNRGIEDEGGNFKYAEKYFANLDGPVLEEKCDITSPVTQEKLNQLDDMQPEYYIHEVVEFPTFLKDKVYDSKTGKYRIRITDGIEEDGEISEETVQIVRNKVKQHIIENGGVYCNLRTKNNDFINDKTSSIYDDGTQQATSAHGMTIIGWNDEYPKENFNSDPNKQPVHDGAYLVLNSWGDHYPYMWISYDDSYIEQGLAGFTVVNKTKPSTVEYKFSEEDIYEKMLSELKSYSIEVKGNSNTKTITAIDLIRSIVDYIDLESCGNFGNRAVASKEVFGQVSVFPNLRFVKIGEGLIPMTGVISGDINGNQKIDIGDIVKIFQYMNYEKKPTENKNWNLSIRKQIIADRNHDGKLDLDDVIELEKIIASNNDTNISNKYPEWSKVEILKLYNEEE